jgi:hypothetical protein
VLQSLFATCLRYIHIVVANVEHRASATSLSFFGSLANYVTIDEIGNGDPVDDQIIYIDFLLFAYSKL